MVHISRKIKPEDWLPAGEMTAKQYCEKQGGEWTKNVCLVADENIRETLYHAIIFAMGADFRLVKDSKQVRLIMEQHPHYRTALYPVLDVVENKDEDYDEIWRELSVKHGYTLGDFSGGRVFKTTTEAMDFIQELKSRNFQIALDI